MSIKSVQFFHHDGSPFALVHNAECAFHLWKAGRWSFEIDGQQYEPDDWRGRCAIESLFGTLCPFTVVHEAGLNLLI